MKQGHDAIGTDSHQERVGPRRQRRGASQWAALITRQRESGVSVRRFCLEHGLGEASFYAWRRRLRGQAVQVPDEPPRFVRLESRGHGGAGESVEVRFACGARLQCPVTCLPELVRLLRDSDGEAEPC